MNHSQKIFVSRESRHTLSSFLTVFFQTGFLSTLERIEYRVGFGMGIDRVAFSEGMKAKLGICSWCAWDLTLTFRIQSVVELLGVLHSLKEKGKPSCSDFKVTGDWSLNVYRLTYVSKLTKLGTLKIEQHYVILSQVHLRYWQCM
jgi:hypothetical protein